MSGPERYRHMTGRQYEKLGVMGWLCRIPADRVLIPRIDALNGLEILDVGLGSGTYTCRLLGRNQVVGVDRNPHLCELDVPIHQGDAGELSRLVEVGRFEVVLSTWMTDYLDPEALAEFFRQAGRVLRPGGRLMTTVILRGAFGRIYTTLAKTVRGVDKYTYRPDHIRDLLRRAGFTKAALTPLPMRCRLRWACWVDATYGS